MTKHNRDHRIFRRFRSLLHFNYSAWTWQMPRNVESYLTRKNITLYWKLWELVQEKNERQRWMDEIPMGEVIGEFTCHQLHDDGTTTKIL